MLGKPEVETCSSDSASAGAVRAGSEDPTEDEGERDNPVSRPELPGNDDVPRLPSSLQECGSPKDGWREGAAELAALLPCDVRVFVMSEWCGGSLEV